MEYEYVEYVRRPFVVTAIQLDENNIEDLAHLIGKIETKEDGKKQITIDRQRCPGVLFTAYPGFWITKTPTPSGENIRCYSRKMFRRQFALVDGDVKKWLEYLDPDRPRLFEPQDGG